MFDFENALCIWGNDTQKENNYIQFKRIINIDNIRNIESAFMFLTADTNYTLYINGNFVDCGLYQYGKDKFAVDKLDIKNFLKNGKNIIGITVHYQGALSFQYVKKRAGLIYKIQIGDNIYYSGSDTYYREDKCYLKGEYTKTTYQLGFNYLYNAAAEDDWLNTDYIENDFKGSFTTQPCGEIFAMRPIKKCDLLKESKGKIVNCGYFLRKDKESGDIAKSMQTDFLQTKYENEITDDNGFLTFNEESDGIFLIYDLSCEKSGYFTISLESDSQNIIDISYGEHLKDLRVRAKIGQRNFANRYICKMGEQRFTHYFHRIACRYIQINIHKSLSDNRIKINDVGLIPCEYKIAHHNKIDIDDLLFKKIYEVSKYTLSLCMHEHYEDTPWREQALYAMDSRNQALFGYYAFSEYEFAKASINLLGESLRSDNYLDLVAPTDDTLTIPYFSLMWIVELNEYMMYSGDIDFANNYILQTEKMIDCYLSNTRNGLPTPPEGKDYWSFYDWADGLDGESDKDNKPENDVLYQLFLIFAMQNHDNMAIYCSKAQRSYKDEIKSLQKKINNIFWDNTRKLYATFIKDGRLEHYCELSQALSLLTDTCSDEHKEHLADMLTCQDNQLVKTTLSLSIFKIQALMKYREKYKSFVVEYVGEIWGNMLFNNATSFWETQKGESDFDRAGSLSHGWSTLPIYVLYAFFEGIIPIKPGFKEFEHNPIDSFIKRVELLTPNGTITSKVQ